MPQSINMIDAAGEVHPIDSAAVQDYLARGWSVEGDAGALDRINAEVRASQNAGAANAVYAGANNALDSATFGGLSASASALGGSEAREYLRNLNEAHPIPSVVGSIVGAVTSPEALPAGLAAKLGSRVAKTAEGAGTVERIARTAGGNAIESGLQGLGQGITEVALSDKKLSIEHLTSSISSNMLYSGVPGGVVGGLGKAAELGLMKAKKGLDAVAARQAAVGSLDDDLAVIAQRDGVKGLNAAAKAEEDVVRAARVPEQAKFVDDLKAHRQQLETEKIWLATKDVDAKAVGNVKEIGKISFDADKSIRSMLNNPKNLAENPKRALEALQRQENALEMLAKNEQGLRTAFAADTSGTRAAALDALPSALERNRGLQSKVREFMAPPSSARLTAIEDAKAALSMPGKPEGFGEKMLTGMAFSGAAGLAYDSGIPGAGVLAPLLGAGAAGMVGRKVFGRLGKAAGAQAERTSKAVGAFLDVSRKVAPAVPVLATKVLAAVRYGESEKPAKGAKAEKATLAKVYKARTDELKGQTAYDPTGAIVMRPEARKAMASRLVAVRAQQPILADRMETIAARRIEFLSSKIPRRPDLGTLQTGPDNWQPSDMEMRTFARYAAAVEDPGAVEERLAAGTVTPEDAEAFRAVYPERLAEITRQIMEKLPALRESLPYQRRLALSIFSGAPVDAAMHPRILAQLQASFANEDGSEGGTQAPAATPQFGSVSSKAAPAPTPAQERSS